MNDIFSLKVLGEDIFESVSDLVGILDKLPPDQKITAFHSLADLLESFEEFSNVRRVNQPPPDNPEKTERVDVLVNWLREKAKN